jgi:uncharacterized membrane protein SpoIIM required for sporulation
MNLDAFLTERRPDWDELGRAAKGRGGRPEQLGPDGVRRLGQLYRAASADLALLRRTHGSDASVRALEDLVGRARLAVYDSEPRRESARYFISRGYWQRVRERPALLIVAWALLLVSGVLGAFWAAHDPAAAVGILPQGFQGVAEPHSGIPRIGGAKAGAVSTQIFTNNIRVMFLSFAAGITGGIGTGLLLLYNGVLLGVVGGLGFGLGTGGQFVELVAPHGVLELSCIAVGASAGLRIGWALVSPGPRKRGVALRRESRRAVEIVIGTMPWLVVAGLVEGFVTPQRVGVVPGLAVGFGLGAIYWALVLWRGSPSSRTVTAAPAPSH